MLYRLHIENVAVIDEVDVEFSEGFNVLTGETGAGKSIIIDSINMVLGERTSRDLIRSGKDKALVEALFYLESEVLRELSKILNLDLEMDANANDNANSDSEGDGDSARGNVVVNGDADDNAFIVTREIASNGRNVCKVNGRIVTSSILKDIGRIIVNIHGQHDNQALLQSDKHIDFLDSYAGKGLLDIKKEYKKLYDETNKIKSEIKSISIDEREKERRIDLLSFQLKEINSAKLISGEEEALETSLKLSSNSEKIMSVVSDAYEKLYSGSHSVSPVHDNLAAIIKELSEIVSFDSELQRYYEGLEEISYQIDEFANEIREYRDRFEFDPSQLQALEQRMDVIFKLKRKYGSSIDEVLQYGDDIEAELQEITFAEENLQKLSEQLEENIKLMTMYANKMSENRQKASAILGENIIAELKDLDMAGTVFEVNIEKCVDVNGRMSFTGDGIDKIEFIISTNPGEPLKPLSKIASGGEMSRIMLAIKKVLADTDRVNTLIFDEIDNGVSGRAANKIANKLSFVSKNKQVLCITHLPQIASMADHHYLIQKNVIDEKSSTIVKKLDNSSRKNEIARIIGGETLTDLALKHAEEMINIANKNKQSS